MVYSDHVPATAGDTGNVTPGAVGAVHPRRLHGRRLLDREHGARERDRRHADGVRRRTRPRRRRPPPTRTGSRTPRSPSTSVRRSTAPRATRSARRAGVKFGQRVGTPDAAADRAGRLQRLPGAVRREVHRPADRRRTPNLIHNGYQVTDANGNLVDLDGNTLSEPFSGTPGFPGFSPTATQTLAVPGRHAGGRHPGHLRLHLRPARAQGRHETGCTTGRNAGRRGRPARPGRLLLRRRTPSTTTRRSRRSSTRLATDGITPTNTLFVISAEENDQFAGANVGRATAADAGRLRRRHRGRATTRRARSASCRRTSRACSRAPPSSSTQFDIEPQGASIYVHGQPGRERPDGPPARARHGGDDRPNDPYSGVDDEKIAQLPGRRARAARPAPADRRPAADADLHALPEAGLLLRRTTSATPNVEHQHRLRLRPRLLQPEHRHHLGRRSPGQAWPANGVDGPEPGRGQPAERPGVDEHGSARRAGRARGSRRPTSGRRCCYLARSDRRLPVRRPRDHAGPDVGARASSRRRQELAAAYDQINSSVGQFATDTLLADTKALAVRLERPTTAPT